MFTHKELLFGVRFNANSEGETANVRWAAVPRRGTTCEWEGVAESRNFIAMQDSSQANLRCRRDSWESKSAVIIDRANGSARMKFDWQAYAQANGEYLPVNLLQELQQKMAALQIQINEGLQKSSVPVGSIVPFFGPLDMIPEGWHVCNGGTLTNYSKNFVDADPNVDGVQVPDLRQKFIRGSENPIGSNGLTVGGKESVTIEHAHEWARVADHRWFSYDDQGQRFRVDDWGDGIGSKGNGEFPLKSHDNRRTLSFYTDQTPIEVKTLPPYVNILYIIKVKK